MAMEVEGIKFYTIHEIADRLKVTPQTIRAYIKKGRLKGIRIGRPLYVTEKNLLEFLETSR